MQKKILICAPAWLGDMIMAQALLKQLHQQGCQLHVLAAEWNFAVLERMPEVSQCLRLPITHGEFKLGERYRLGKSLRAEKYDQAIILQNSWKSALIPFFAKIPQRTGWLGESRYGLVNDARRLDKKALPLMVQRYVALAYDKKQTWAIDDFPHPRLQVDVEVRQKTLQRLQLTEDKPIIALSPGAAFGVTKQWPAEHYAEVANERLENGWQVWLFGSAKDRAVTDKVMRFTKNRCVNLAGKLKLFETVDLISAAKALIGNDSGLLHVAAALQVPVIGLYGSTTPDFTPPLSESARTLFVKNLACRPCFKRECRYGHLACLRDIQPARVQHVLQELLEVASAA